MTMMTNKVTRRVLFLRRALFVGLLIAFSYYSLFHNRQGRMYKRSDVDNEQVVRGTTKQPNASSPSTSTSSTITAVASNDRESSSTSDTTIIITSSLIPSHPSTIIIDTTIQSIYDHVRGLDRTTTPMIIAIDGIRPKERSDENAQRYDEMVQSLQRNYSNATILPHVNSMGLKRTVREALDLVTTTYVYLLQHDLRFYQDINHLAIVKTMGEYPDELDIVRFNLRMNQKAMTDNTTCFGRPSKNLNAVNGINFTKAGSWSDNNQFATKTYYDTLFAVHLKNSKARHPMEWRMAHLVAQNCSLAPWLYGAIRDGPYLSHLDGRMTQLEDLLSPL